MKFAILICFLIFQIQFNNGAKLPSSSLMKNSNSNEYMDRLSPTIFFSKAERSNTYIDQASINFHLEIWSFKIYFQINLPIGSSKEQAKQHHVDMSYSQSLVIFLKLKP